MYAIYGNIYYQYTPNFSIYTSTMDPMGIDHPRFSHDSNTTRFPTDKSLVSRTSGYRPHRPYHLTVATSATQMFHGGGGISGVQKR